VALAEPKSERRQMSCELQALVSNEITINVAGPVRSLFTTFQTPRHFVDTRLNDNKADRHNSKHITSFFIPTALYIVLVFTKLVLNLRLTSIPFVFNVSDLYKLQTSLAK
jgi:hypothetical protein